MALFDIHDKCARCHENKIGEDPCVFGLDSPICTAFILIRMHNLRNRGIKSRKTKLRIV